MFGTKREIKQLRREVQDIKDEVRAMRYERLDSLISEMKEAAKDMLTASRVMVGKAPEPETENPSGLAGVLSAIDGGEYDNLPEETRNTLRDEVEKRIQREATA